MALGGLGDARADGLIDRVIRQEVRDERPALLATERFEQDRRRVQLPAGPSRVIVEQLGARHAREQDRGVPSEVGDVLDELQERRLGPLEVVDHEDDGPIDGETLEQRPERPERLLRRASRSRRCRSPARPAPRSPRRRSPDPDERGELGPGGLGRVGLVQIRERRSAPRRAGRT